MTRDFTKVVKKDRQQCHCNGQGQHKLISNCIKCGKIVCEVEGEGPCLFCGNWVEQALVYSELVKRQDKLGKSSGNTIQDSLFTANSALPSHGWRRNDYDDDDESEEEDSTMTYSVSLDHRGKAKVEVSTEDSLVKMSDEQELEDSVQAEVCLDPVEAAEQELAEKRAKQQKFRMMRCQELDDKSQKLFNLMKAQADHGGPAWLEEEEEEIKDDEDDQNQETNAFEEMTSNLSS